MPKNIDIITILPKGFSLTPSDIQNSDENIRFVYLDSQSLAQEIAESDIQIVIIDKDIKSFTRELYDTIDKEFLSIYFNPIKINNISASQLDAIKNMQKLKKHIDNPKSFDIEQIKEDLKNKILKKEEALKPKIDTAYLESIKINKYFSIKNMEIRDLKGKKEIYFVGENGDGKTVLLQAIILALKHDEYSDLAKLYIDDEKEKYGINISTKDSKNSERYIEHKNLKNIFAYGINRNKINNKESEKSLGYSALFDTPSITRTTYLREPEILLAQKSNIIDKFAEQITELMGGRLEILRSINKVEFRELNGDKIKFDMLSEGYKTTLIWLCDLLSRLIENDKENEIEKLEDFKAIVLIDEVDLYLHPKWKYDFMNKLRKIFPKIQFIMTTHSLVTVLGASKDAVFYKVYKEGKDTKITEQIDDISYYTSDILMSSPLFNMKTIKSRTFDEKESLSSDDYVYHRIHKKIKERINETPTATDKEVDSWLDDAFDDEFGE